MSAQGGSNDARAAGRTGSVRGVGTAFIALLLATGLPACHKSLSPSIRFECAGPDDRGCGSGCSCVAANSAAYDWWCDCPDLTSDPGNADGVGHDGSDAESPDVGSDDGEPAETGGDALPDGADIPFDTELPATCGDGVCDGIETRDNCCRDCGCAAGWACVTDACIEYACPSGYVLLQPGLVRMGSPADEPGRRDDESDPSAADGLHAVLIGYPICVKTTEVTQAEWKAVFTANPSVNVPCDDCPVEHVTWWESLAFCNALSDAASPPRSRCYDLEGCTGTPGKDYACTSASFAGTGCNGFRLPSEAEWEYAARASTPWATWKGHLDELKCHSTVLEPIAWYSGNSCPTDIATNCVLEAGCRPRAVGAAGHANPFGLSDMLGNVWEWVQDCYGSSYQGAPSDGSPRETGCDGDKRVFRGGSWNVNAAFVRAACRGRDGVPGLRSDGIGFRVVRTVP